MISARLTSRRSASRTLREGEVQRAVSSAASRRCDVGVGLFVARGARVELFLRDGVLLDSRLGAVALGLRQRAAETSRWASSAWACLSSAW